MFVYGQPDFQLLCWKSKRKSQFNIMLKKSQGIFFLKGWFGATSHPKITWHWCKKKDSVEKLQNVDGSSTISRPSLKFDLAIKYTFYPLLEAVYPGKFLMVVQWKWQQHFSWTLTALPHMWHQTHQQREYWYQGRRSNRSSQTTRFVAVSREDEELWA